VAGGRAGRPPREGVEAVVNGDDRERERDESAWRLVIIVNNIKLSDESATPIELE
jgi:hypothetical protein